ncbi:hypothetical protein GCM10009847_05070 [Leucobacter tardus]|uniref:DUF2269 family protein n=1 Tax=Leucobacter tardus TaxID=501483 RepID=A0A939QBH8_9MICO|nr:DUF2269 family protein [Leucobacter tardus]MBO2988711.1 hypothetical protein [Leucobacter tardus]
MTGFLLAVHVLAAILTIGPVAIAASMFPPAVRASLEDPGNHGKVAVVRVLHRITRVYAVIGIIVPIFGIATGASLGVLGDAWLLVSMTLTAIAAILLIATILPRQRHLVTTVGAGQSDDTVAATSRATRKLAMSTGIFNLLWAIVVVLMIYRPGSTTGAGA